MVVRRKGSENDDKQSLSTRRRKRNSHISERFGRHCQQGFPVRLWVVLVVTGTRERRWKLVKWRWGKFSCLKIFTSHSNSKDFLKYFPQKVQIHNGKLKLADYYRFLLLCNIVSLFRNNDVQILTRVFHFCGAHCLTKYPYGSTPSVDMSSSTKVDDIDFYDKLYFQELNGKTMKLTHCASTSNINVLNELHSVHCLKSLQRYQKYVPLWLVNQTLRLLL